MTDILAFILGILLTALAAAGIAQATGAAVPWQPITGGVAMAAPAPATAPAPTPAPAAKPAPEPAPAPKPKPKADSSKGCGQRAVNTGKFNPACKEYQGYLDPGSRAGRGKTSGEIQNEGTGINPNYSPGAAAEYQRKYGPWMQQEQARYKAECQRNPADCPLGPNYTP